MTQSIDSRIAGLRSLMTKHNLSAYVVPSSDAHQSEYVAPKWARREFMSGFSGSAGLFALNQETAGLWTDGRYFEQAEEELKGSAIQLFRQGVSGVPEWQEWMTNTLAKGSRIGLNPELFSSSAYQRIESGLKQAGLDLVPLAEDLVDKVWGESKPELPKESFYTHPLRYAGVSHLDKLAKVRHALAEAKGKAIVVSALDEIAWLFNLRGRDVPNNPVFYAYAIVTADRAELFTEVAKIGADTRGILGDAVQVRPYHDFFPALDTLEGPVWLDPQTSSAAVESRLKSAGKSSQLKDSPIPAWKAVKNASELLGMKAAHVRDGAAMVKFSRWLKETIGKSEITEISAADKLESFRRLDKAFRGPSFATIAGYQGHGALPHYRSTPTSNVALKAEGIFLLDSGAQYDDGTTDITRTYALGQASERQKHVYTSVLKGHLLLARSLFPKGTNGYQLDAIARQPIWKEGLDYNHGTGHGVGAALCVHEGPFSVSLRKNMTPLEAGHILSNEPACYFPGDFGVRIENLVTVVEKKGGPFGSFLGFEDLTLCPYERSLIETALLSAEDIGQVNAYHARVRAELSPLLDAADRAFLEEATRPL